MSDKDLGPQEKAVLDVITANPFIGQAEIASALGLARSTVAAHIVSLGRKGYILGRGYVLPRAKKVICIGGAVVDRKYHAVQPIRPETSNPVTGRRSFGGVARNVCENLARLGVETGMVSLLGEDDAGRALAAHLRNLGIDTAGISWRHGAATAEYVAVLDTDSSLVVGLADMGIFDSLDTRVLESAWPNIAAANWVFCDCNPTSDFLHHLTARRHSARFRLAIDAVSSPKVQRLPERLEGIDLLFLNMDEAVAYLGIRNLSPEDAALALLERGAGEVVLTLGSRGALAAGDDGVILCEAVPCEPVDVTGAGDALIAGTLFSLLSGDSLTGAVRTGCLLAALTTESEASVHQELSAEFLARSMGRIENETGAANVE
ncbi:pseudouridine kinase [Mesorhizobium sp. J18]|uniref:carbohydrate kinase n=1 Tax=Mesorhizobium sp. J18 TaxID=935263 RepID=UPI00119B0612|nr:carbohydrate kinase [Mesorhizobium sp. J18]TWG94821.1 pseudouridine kinase [Mesorhizobium sp. J18]